MAAGLVEGFLSVGVAGFALLLMVVALAAWRRMGGGKLAALAGAFGLFFLKGLWFTWLAFGPARAPLEAQLLLPDFAILALLYLATAR